MPFWWSDNFYNDLGLYPPSLVTYRWSDSPWVIGLSILIIIKNRVYEHIHMGIHTSFDISFCVIVYGVYTMCMIAHVAYIMFPKKFLHWLKLASHVLFYDSHSVDFYEEWRITLVFIFTNDIFLSNRISRYGSLMCYAI